MRVLRPRFGKKNHIRYTGICGRCNFRFDADTLVDDLNIPGLKVCPRPQCRDTYNLWQHGVRKIDTSYVVPWTRPDVDIAVPPNPVAPDGPTAV